MSKLNGIKLLSKLNIPSLKVKLTLKAVKIIVVVIAIIMIIFLPTIITVIEGTTGNVESLFDAAVKKKDIKDATTANAAEIFNGFSEEEIDQLVKDSGALLAPEKIKLYIQREQESIPPTIQGTKTIIEDSVQTNSTVDININDFASKYKLNWQFLCAVDLAAMTADDKDDKTVYDNSSKLYPVFEWANNYSTDTTDMWKQWQSVVEYEIDNETKEQKGDFIEIENHSSEAIEHTKIVKEPLAIPKKVITMFGDYIYKVNQDVTVKNEDYSAPFIESTEKTERQEYTYSDYVTSGYEFKDQIYFTGENGKEYIGEVSHDKNTNFNIGAKYTYSGVDGDYIIFTDGVIFKDKLYINKSAIPEGDTVLNITLNKVYEESVRVPTYEEVKHYKTIVTEVRTMKQTKEKIVTDQVASIKQKFDPSIFMDFIKINGLSANNLDLIYNVLESIPSGDSLSENILKIITGDYGNIEEDSSSIDANADVSGVIPLFLQADARWGDKVYYVKSNGTVRTIAEAGCGPTSLSMVVTGLGGSLDNVKGYDENGDGVLTPDDVVKFSKENGFYSDDGTSFGLYAALGTKMGLSVTQVSNYNEAYDALKQGKIVIASVNGATPFTKGGHLIVLTGVDNDGRVKVNDPASQERSDKTWDMVNDIAIGGMQYFIFENPNFVTETFTITSYFGATWRDSPPLTSAEVTMEGEGALITSQGVDLSNKDLRDRLCAVDPSVIPYHSKLYINFGQTYPIKMPDGIEVDANGYYSAEDTGGAFNGGARKIDIYSGTFGNSPLYKQISLDIGTRQATVRYRRK